MNQERQTCNHYTSCHEQSHNYRVRKTTTVSVEVAYKTLGVFSTSVVDQVKTIAWRVELQLLPALTFTAESVSSQRVPIWTLTLK